MAYIVDFGENKISDYCTVLNVKRSILPTRSNSSKQIPTMDGSYFTGTRYEERKISLEVAILSHKREDYISQVSALAQILDVKEPAELIIDDEPWKCYYAVLDGSTDLNKFAQTGKATLEFICHDPFGYSLDWNSYEPDENGIFAVESFGTTETYPTVAVDFNSKGCFFQLTNPIGETVLIGTPKNSTKDTIKFSDTPVNDKCEDSTTFISMPDTLLDSNRKNVGSFGVGMSGNAIIPTNYGTGVEKQWTGTSFKRNIGRNISQFEITADVTFSSKGDNYKPPTPKPPVTVKPAPTPPNKNNKDTTTPPSNCLGTFKVNAKSGLWINREPNKKHRLHAMSYGEVVYPVEKSGNWYKHTKKYSNGKSYTGWSYAKYLTKVAGPKKKRKRGTRMFATKFSTGADVTPKKEYADDQMGLLEIYGYDQNGQKLFKMVLEDSNEYYEYVKPSFYIGSKKVLDDKKNVPSPRKVDIKDTNGKVTGKENAASGVFGDFNDFEGQLVIKKQKNSKNQDLWDCQIRKIKDGKCVKTLSLSNAINNNEFPKGDLNYIGVFMGRYDTKTPVSVIALRNLKVKQLNMKTDQQVSQNVQIFEEEDHMIIDFESGLVTLNDQPILQHLDIGSDFFTLPAGESEFLYKTDAKDVSVVAGFRDKFV